MIIRFGLTYRRPCARTFASAMMVRMALLSIGVAWVAGACTQFVRPELKRDEAAQRVAAVLLQTNMDLVRFKCVGKITLTGPNQPDQSYRAAIAGRLDDHLRIDLFTPFGGSAGSISSDGKHLFLVMHASKTFHKQPFGEGSLNRFIHIDVTVDDVLEILVGRIPIDAALIPRMPPTDDSIEKNVQFVDRWGRERQRISLDSTGRPTRSVWFDSHHQQEMSLTVTGRQVVDGFVLPDRIELRAVSGQSVSFTLERYEANAQLNEDLFVPPPISS